MKNLKYLFTALLLLCATVATAHDFEVGGIYYNITSTTDFTVEVTYKGDFANSYSNEYSGNVVIPESVTYNGSTYSVTSIGEWAFDDCSRLTSVVIPNGVTSIGGGAFYGCSGLTSVVIPNSVTSIGDYAFSDCTGLTSVEIPNSVTSIGERAFRYCSGLTSVEIPNSVTSIGKEAFRGCSGLTCVVIGNSVTSIGDRAFEYCRGLKKVINFSSLTFSKGSTDYGYVACYAETVINAPNGSVEGDFVFAVIDGVNTLCLYVGAGGDVTLPADYKGENYVIGANVFDNNTSLTSVVIPNSVTSIGSYAFYGCSSLTSVVIGNGVISIGDYAFRYCSGLTSVVIPNSVTSIGSYAFYNCSSLTSVVIGNGVISIGSYAFYHCSGLKEVHISDLSAWCGIDFGSCYDNPLYYAENLYLNDELLTELTIPDSVTEVKNFAFYNCSVLTNVVIPDGVTEIKGYAFENCSGLKSVVISNSVTSIGVGAFSGCSGLKKVINCSSLKFLKGSTDNGYVAYNADTVIDAPNGSVEGDFVFGVINGVNTLCAYIGAGGDVTLPADYNGENYVIGADAFRGCSALTSVVIPNSVTSIGWGAFYNCSGLKEVHISDLSAWCGIDFDSSSTNPLYYAHNLYLNGELVTNLVIPDGITEIKDYAFSGCSGLTSVVIPNSVTSIGEDAFYDCSGLKKVINFSSLTFSKGSTANGYVAYYADTVINAPNGPVEGDFVFAVIDGVNTLCAYIGAGGDVTLPADYNGENYAIGADAFRGCSGLTSVVIPNSVTSIGDNAFYGCSGLKKVINCSSLKFSKGSTDNGYVAYNADTVINAPNGSVEGDFVFGVIDGVNTLCAYIGAGGDVTLPADYKGENYVIGANVFNNNTSLTGVVIPAAVTSIGTDVFSNCRGLKEVHISDLSAWCGIDFSGLNANPLYYAHNLYLNGELVTDLVIPDGVTEIKRYAFEGCSGLTGVVIPNSVTSIGMCAFDGCTGLTSVVVGNSVTSIGEWAFYNCRSLTSVVIPSSVTSIGDYAFRDCRGLTGITSMIPAEDLFSVTNDAFDYNCVLYVPKGAKETYASTDGWSNFKNIVETDFTGIDEVKGENGKVKGVYYDLNGRAVERPANGLYIKNGKKVFVK